MDILPCIQNQNDAPYLVKIMAKETNRKKIKISRNIRTHTYIHTPQFMLFSNFDTKKNTVDENKKTRSKHRFLK